MKSFLMYNKILKKVIIYYTFILRPNIYTNLYFNNIISKYTILNNIIIFSSKDKY